MPDDERAWREGWALAYSGIANLYHDDGELQDNRDLPIDWMRDPPLVIQAKIRGRGMRKLQAMKTGADHGAGPFGPRLSGGLGLAVDADTVSADPVREVMRMFTTLPRKGTPAADLTEGEKLALCIAAGAPTETMVEGGLLTVRTTVPCGVADRGDGGYIVAVGTKPTSA
jgi:hypothetical protein